MAREMPKLDGVEHRFVEANGLRFHVAEAGDADADALILVHGWPQNWYEWRNLIGPLSESRRVICPDLRGLGWSDAPPAGYDKEQLADDVLAIMDALEIDRAGLVGHDWGGWAGFLACLKAPDRFEAYLAMAIPPPFAKRNLRSMLDTWRLSYQLPLASPWGHRVSAALAEIRRPGLRDLTQIGSWEREARDVFLGQFAEPEIARATIGYYRTFLLRELPGLASGLYDDAYLEVRTRLLFPENEKVMSPAMLEIPEGSARDFEVEIVPGAGHFIVDEMPDLVLERIRTHFGIEAAVPAATAGS
jgi:pimeloyl-ACP methyl ester carboxylesterase